MMNFICSIPEWIGWCIVIGLSIPTIILWGKIIITFVQMYYDSVAER